MPISVTIEPWPRAAGLSLSSCLSPDVQSQTKPSTARKERARRLPFRSATSPGLRVASPERALRSLVSLLPLENAAPTSRFAATRKARTTTWFSASAVVIRTPMDVVSAIRTRQRAPTERLLRATLTAPSCRRRAAHSVASRTSRVAATSPLQMGLQRISTWSRVLPTWTSALVVQSLRALVTSVMPQITRSRSLVS